MSVEENKATARRWNEEIINKKRVEAFDEVLHRDYANHSGSDSSWALGIQGREQARAALDLAPTSIAAAVALEPPIAIPFVSRLV